MSNAVDTQRTKFTIKAVEAMNRAYEDVCSILEAGHAGYAARIKAGEAIMHLARSGETDERRLCDQALSAAGYASTYKPDTAARSDW